MSRISLFLNESPFLYRSHIEAIDYLRAGDDNLIVERVFFYQDATLVALDNQRPTQGQPSMTALWQEVADRRNAPLQVCIANAIRRGLFDAQEAARYDTRANLAAGFELTGLGDIAEAVAKSDRLLQFQPHGLVIHPQSDNPKWDLMIHITTPPTLDSEVLELGMACAAFDQTVCFVFSEQGLQWLYPDLGAQRPGGKSPAKLLSALNMYDCDDLFVVGASDSMHAAAQVIDADGLADLRTRCRHYLEF